MVAPLTTVEIHAIGSVKHVDAVHGILGCVTARSEKGWVRVLVDERAVNSVKHVDAVHGLLKRRDCVVRVRENR